MLSSHGALMHLESEIRKWGEIAGRLRTEAGVAYDALVNDPELAFLAPAVEQLRENVLTALNQFYDGIPPALGQAMDNAQEFALEE